MNGRSATGNAFLQTLEEINTPAGERGRDMILRFKTQDNTHFLNINFSGECYNFGETAGRNYITVSEKGYCDILGEIDFNCYDYIPDFKSNDPADYHPFIKSDLNEMCLNCRHLYNLCNGTKSKLYSGCVWKEASPESFKRYLEIERGEA